MRQLVACWLGISALLVTSLSMAQEAEPTPETAPAATAAPAPAEAGAEAPAEAPGLSEVVVMASGTTDDVTEEALSQARVATVAAAAAAQARHQRAVRPERDPGLNLRAASCEDANCFGAVGQDAQAAFLFVLLVERAGDGHRANVMLVDTEAVQIVGSAAFDLPSDPSQFADALREPIGPLLQAISPLHALVGTLTVTVDHVGAGIFLDDERVGSSPMAPMADLEPGPHALRVVMEGYLDFEQSVEVVAAETATVQVVMEEVPPETVATVETPVWRRWWFWTIIGGAVAVTALGVGLGVGLSDDGDTNQQWGVPFPRVTER